MQSQLELLVSSHACCMVSVSSSGSSDASVQIRIVLNLIYVPKPEWKGRSDGFIHHALFTQGRNFPIAIFAIAVEGSLFYLINNIWVSPQVYTCIVLSTDPSSYAALPSLYSVLLSLSIYSQLLPFAILPHHLRCCTSAFLL